MGGGSSTACHRKSAVGSSVPEARNMLYVREFFDKAIEFL